jgi:hypothetical protein
MGTRKRQAKGPDSYARERGIEAGNEVADPGQDMDRRERTGGGLLYRHQFPRGPRLTRHAATEKMGQFAEL